MTKLCFIGCGAHAQQVYAPTLRRLADEDDALSLACCCDLDASRAAAMADLAGFQRSSADWEAMLEREKPEAVLLVTPYTFTGEIACRIVRMGIPVLIEKPPGDSLESCLNIYRAAGEGGAPAMVAFNRRHLPLIRACKEKLAADGTETLQNIQYSMYRVHRTEDFFFVTAIHGVDAVRFLAGSDYQDIRFAYQPLPRLGEGCCNLFMDCAMENGTQAQLQFLVQSGMVAERFTLTAADLCYNLNIPIWHGCDTPGLLERCRCGTRDYLRSGDEISDGRALFETNGFYEQVRVFLECARGQRPLRDDLKSALQPVEIMDCIRRRQTRYHK
ncbi:MAG: Gfo/Idh/MocA family oxidoreductase [Provencibacterium sp.]|jgi:myo-inositol 2-dehydrogenase/D-chiro-inositol 1-dehydrogenase|nr:Gfo/Idh/MocA family oxidoreductase [Provencibacterium sp.]